MTKEEYIGCYLEKKLKDNTLPYGLQYLNLVGDLEERAEKHWKRKTNRTEKPNTSKNKL